MRNHIFAVILVLPLTVCSAAAQTSYQPPRLLDGKPDLQGVWDFRTLTPLERPEDAASKARLTSEEAAAIEAKAAARSAADDARKAGVAPLPAGRNLGPAYNDFWLDRGARVVEDQRTSLIVDPPDGRLPALRPGVEKQVGSLQEDLPGKHPVRIRAAGIGTGTYEDRGLAERCILGFNAGPPIVPGGYNQNIQIFQTPTHVAILNEMVHDARIVPLDGRAHLSSTIRQWMGDSRGHWEGDTLVIETTNFTDKTASFNPSVTMAIGTGVTLRLTERFRRVADNTLLYEYTIDDSKTFTRPFTVRLPMKRGDTLFEYACHEGNHGLMNMLLGARAAEGAPAARPGSR
jgi:hypothetical protein